MNTRVPGLSTTVAALYDQTRAQRVAYIDETYSLDLSHGERFYTVTAVLIEADARDGLRTGIRQEVGSDYWHTTEELRTAAGRARTLSLLDYLADSHGSEACVVAHTRNLDADDHDGELARSRALTRLLTNVCSETDDAAVAVVLEARRGRALSNRDAATKADAVATGQLDARIRMLQTSPRDENLLWLPDLVCSAHRQVATRSDRELFDRITTEIEA